jgi:methyl-accepting chemotaxis protein
MFKFLQGFYTIIAIHVVSVLFANRIIILINSAIILGSTTRVYFYAIDQVPEQTEFFKSGYINHTVALVLITTIIYFAVKFTEGAIAASKKETRKKEAQNIQLNEIIKVVKSTSSILKNLSNELSELAHDVSQNSNQQAANVEEISATIEEITASIIENSGDTQTTAQTVNKTTEFARKSENVISNSLEAIKNIDSRIGLIQEIAFQTNILSLNAAIEAARAGQAGRGFSVVANEVKKLAEHSDTGAKEIIGLVKGAIVGSDEASNYLKNITEDIKNINELINKIANASLEQKGSVEQINHSVAQINSGAQHNAAVSEKLADAVRQISMHAGKLTEILNS